GRGHRASCFGRTRRARLKAKSVTLEEIVSAATARRASLVPETSGYIMLAVCDALGGAPLLLDPQCVSVTIDGAVAIGGTQIVEEHDAVRAARALLATLLGASVGSMQGLAVAARPRGGNERGLTAMTSDLEAALIPVNRAAGRRAIARLARE